MIDPPTTDDLAVMRSVIADAPDALLIRELERRGYTVTDGQLPFVWDIDASEDEEDGACQAVMSA